MKCCSEKSEFHSLRNSGCPAFSLMEIVAALAILALICSSVLVVINRCIASAADSALRMNAFEITRENMERLLVSDTAAEMTEYGSSEKYPNIQWQTTVEAFYEPSTSRMWLKGYCSAEYTDTAGESQKIELTHWLTDLTKEQFLRIIEEKRKQDANSLSADQIIETEDKAAEYAGVDVQTIRQWVDAGMHKTAEGYYITAELDLYKRAGGKPTIEDRRQYEQALKDKTQLPEKTADKSQQQAQQDKPDQPNKENSTPQQSQNEKHGDSAVKRYCGYTLDEICEMPFDQMFKILMNCEDIWHK